ncbi:MAG TPA: hypothetical protein VF733_02585 [Candidatus Saccharimonadales bacterium]
MIRLRKNQKILLGLAVVGVAMYGAAYLWAYLYGRQNADANIGAGLLGFSGLVLGAGALFVFILVTLFKKD